MNFIIIARLSIERAHMMENIVKIIEKHDGHSGGLISILQEIQGNYSYLPEEALRLVARETKFSLVDIYGVATFYKSFSLKPRGKHLVTVCAGTACHVRGAPSIAEEFAHNLGIKPGETTPDNEITLETVNCMGACALGPIVVVDGHYFSQVKRQRVKKIIDQARTGLDWVDIKTDERIFPLEVSCPNCNRSLIDRNYYIDGHPSIHVTVSFGTKNSWLRLSCLYGSFSVEHEYEVPIDAIVNFFCPHCHSELIGASECSSCNAPMVPMIVKGGGTLHICSRRGCKGHMLDLTPPVFPEWLIPKRKLKDVHEEQAA
ncbi:MAG: NAD(P)H-dependent oxidoreductase subunit E [Desulfobacteraceae bacterium]|nr:NAD(P)H-dependent oxidoreductase subunit E [Desulfobacteraceae bacterium]